MELTEAMLIRLLEQGNTVYIIKKSDDELADSFKDRLLKKKRRLGVASVPAPTPG